MRTMNQIHSDCNRAGQPCSYWGDHGHWVAVLGQSRDSEAVERSNFRVACAMLAEVDDECYHVDCESHWAVGWVETLLVDPSNAAALAVAEDIRERLDDYPILDESDWSELETEECNENWDNWGRSDAETALRSALTSHVNDILWEYCETLDAESYIEALDLAPIVDAYRSEGEESPNHFYSEKIVRAAMNGDAVDSLVDDIIDSLIAGELVAKMRCGDAAARQLILDLAPEASEFWIEAYYFSRD